MKIRFSLGIAGAGLALTVLLAAQDARERLGPKDQATTATIHPLTPLLERRPHTLRAALEGQHPRVYVTAREIEALRTRAHSTHAALWKEALSELREEMKHDPPPPPAQERRIQNGVGIDIAGFALAYQIEKQPEFLAAAKKYMDAAVSYDIWGYASNKPNVDLAAGHLLYGLGWGYDLLYNELTPAERARYRDKLRRQGNLLADYFRIKPGRSYTYSQNHTFIPIAGLAVAGYALQGEIPEAAQWTALARAIFERVLATYSQDGYYYEGFEYWVFSTPWIVHYLDAQAHAAGEDLYDIPGLRKAYLYVAHTILPDGQNIFDFGDAFEGANTRSGESPDAARTQPGGHLASNYNLLYRLAQRFQDPAAQGVAQWCKAQGQVNAENFWSLLWYDSGLRAVPLSSQKSYHYFPDHDVVYWRSSWTKDATAIAIKSGPPEGHQAARLAAEMPDWRLESGHAHPDAGSFIFFARGKYITGDAGYAGVPQTAQHNTLLIDGRGQESLPPGHNAFTGIPLDRLDRIRIVSQNLTDDGLDVETDFTAAYDPSLGARRVVRRFAMNRGGDLSIADDVETVRPAVVTSLIHCDDKPVRSGPQDFVIGGVVRLSVKEPTRVRLNVDPALLTSAGPPGAVDRGKTEQRGMQISLAAPEPSRITRFRVLFHVE